jgi:hypothetical protein
MAVLSLDSDCNLYEKYNRMVVNGLILIFGGNAGCALPGRGDL